MKNIHYLKEAIEQSRESVKQGGYPAGAVIVHKGEIIAKGFSNGKQQCDATQHAEIDAIRKASRKLQSRNLSETILYASLEPCVMCFSASFWAYIPRVVYAAARHQVDSNYYMGNHSIEQLNAKNCRRKMELVHLEEAAREALEVIQDWENGCS